MDVLEFERVSKTYAGAEGVRALKDISFRLEKGSFSALIGPSGSGKTSLLNLASGLDLPSEGKVRIAGQDISALGFDDLCRFRSRFLGFVFQSYNLFPVLTAVENVEFTSLIRGDPPPEARGRALDCLRKVGLETKAHSLPSKLSGGQQQRVAVARALATDPQVILADEPTANLDSTNALQLVELFQELNARHGVTFLFSTHDPRLYDRVNETLELTDGELTRRSKKELLR